ncbi:hypothetical protein CMI39_03950 [Candidatus Pacearchaeota archaeon]|jgi:hypothetical protein|nr:hypothetical protein [Candidatus Pacearchaeota archaeon]|tara:strand:+ start:5616 stop:5909 length:294 start_codon:yes stop_codon:yes gene_type:complete
MEREAIHGINKIIVALGNIDRTTFYSLDKLKKLGLYDRKLIHPNNGVVYNKDKKVSGASVIKKFKDKYNIPFYFSEKYFNLFTLVEIFQNKEIIEYI